MTAATISSLTLTGSSSPYLYFHKVCLVGESGVGKTSFLLRIKNGRFINLAEERPCHGRADTYKIVRKLNDKDIGLCFNDEVEGLTRTTRVLNFYRGAACILFMFSVNDIYSLEYIDEAMREAENGIGHKKFHYALVGTKNDIGIEDEKFETVIDKKRDKLGFKKVFYISSKTGKGIDQLLDYVAEGIDTCKLAEVNEERIQLEESNFIAKSVPSHQQSCCKT